MFGKSCFAGVLTVFVAACASSNEASSDAGVTTMNVSVSAYCLRGKTASGLPVRTGIAAADPHVLPIGSVIRLYATGRGPAGMNVTACHPQAQHMHHRKRVIMTPDFAPGRRPPQHRRQVTT